MPANRSIRAGRQPLHLPTVSRFHSAQWLLVAAVVFALAACGGGGKATGGAQGSGSGTITFVNAQDPGTFDQLIAGFEKANPSIKVKQQVVPFADLNTTLQSRLSAKDASIDLYEVDEPRLASLASRGYLAPLDDLGKQAQGKVDPKALAATQFNGKQYSMPRWTSSQLLYYNRALLRKAGIAAPSSDPGQPITWEQLATEAKQAQAAGAKWGFTFEQVDLYYQLQPLPESAGGGSGLTGDKMLTPDLTNAGWMKAMTWYASTFTNGISPRGVTAEQTEPLFAGGNTAFFAGGPWNAPLFDKVEGLDYGVAPFPKFAGGKAVSSTGSWSVGISPFSKNQAAAKKFLAYMTIDPNGAWLASSRNIPVQNQAPGQVHAAVERRQVAGRRSWPPSCRTSWPHNAVARPTSVGYVDFETVMNKAFADIRNGTDPAQRLRQATSELNRIFDKYK